MLSEKNGRQLDNAYHLLFFSLGHWAPPIDHEIKRSRRPSRTNRGLTTRQRTLEAIHSATCMERGGSDSHQACNCLIRPRAIAHRNVLRFRSTTSARRGILGEPNDAPCPLHLKKAAVIAVVVHYPELVRLELPVDTANNEVILPPKLVRCSDPMVAVKDFEEIQSRSTLNLRLSVG